MLRRLTLPFPHPGQRLRAPVHVELFENVMHVILHRREADVERARDLLVGEALLDQDQNFRLALGEGTPFVGGGALFRVGVAELSDAICASSRAASCGEQCNSPRTALSTSVTRSPMPASRWT